MQIKWTRKALLTLDSAVEHIAQDNPDAALNNDIQKLQNKLC